MISYIFGQFLVPKLPASIDSRLPRNEKRRNWVTKLSIAEVKRLCMEWPIVKVDACARLYDSIYIWPVDLVKGGEFEQVKDDENWVKNAIIRYGMQTNRDTRPTTYLSIGLLFQMSFELVLLLCAWDVTTVFYVSSARCTIVKQQREYNHNIRHSSMTSVGVCCCC